MSNNALVVGEDGWAEIDGIGEMTRGGTPNFDSLAVVGGPPSNYDVLGTALAQSPAFQNLLAKKAAQGRPVMHKQPLRMARDWDVPLGPVSGAAGTQTTISFQPQAYFRVEKLMATDTATPPGTGTAIVQIAIGQRVQRPGSTAQGTLTQFFAETALANGIKLDTAHPYEAIAITVRFIQSCSFSMVLSGTAEMD